MSTFWNIMIGLMVTLPVGAYVAGNLAGATADQPAPHDPIVIRDARTTPLPDPSHKPGSPTTPADPDRTEDGDDDIEVVRPEPDDVDDDDADEPGGGGDGTDDSAPDDLTDGDTDSGGDDD